MASSTTRPTATARPPRVMMLMVIPVSCMITSAVRIDSGMLIAATMRGPDAEQEHEDGQDREQGAEAAFADEAVARLVDEDGQVRDGRDGEFGGVALADLGELGLDGVGDVDGVGGGRLGDGQAERRIPVGPAVTGRGDGVDLDRAEVAEGDRLRDEWRGGSAGRGRGAGRGRDRPRTAS